MKSKLILTVKIVISAFVAIIIARFLKLDFAVSTGVIAILTIQPTKKETIKTAFARFIALVVALVVSYLCFYFLKVSWTGFFVYLAVFVLFCCVMGWSYAIAPCSVLVAHIVSLGEIDISTITNEVLIFVIGTGVGILANLHLKKQTTKIKELNSAMDEQIVKILKRMSERIMNNKIRDYNGSCFDVLDERIYEAKTVAVNNYHNQFDESDTYDMEYIEMRERQRQVLFEMYKNAVNLTGSPMTATIISDYLKNMAEAFDEKNDGLKLKAEFDKMDDYMKEQPMPVTREEFENRAKLYSLMRSIEEFINIKIDFYKNFH